MWKIMKNFTELINIYDKLGYFYYDLIQDDLEKELETFRKMKKGG